MFGQIEQLNQLSLSQVGSFYYMGIQNHLDLTEISFREGLLVFVREDIPCSILNIKQLTIKALFIEIN